MEDRRRHLRGLLIALAAVLVTVAAPTPASAQDATLPDVDQGARHRVAFRLHLHYVFQRRGRLGGVAFPAGFCDADRGDLCWDQGDWESNCALVRCTSEKQRTRLVEKLGELALEFPHSPEAMGHAIYAAIRLDRFDQVEGLLDECDPIDAWWCDLLRGFLLHRTRRSPEAEAPLERGLRNAPPDIRCRLEDVSELLPEDTRDGYRKIPCDERDETHRMLWWLSDPFYIEPGNDRWVEQVTRRFAILLHIDLLQANARSNAPDLHPDSHDRWMTRRGYDDSFAREGARRKWTSVRGAVNHFLPDAIDLGGLSSEISWRIEGELDDEGYTRPLGRVAQAPGQVVRFLSVGGGDGNGRATSEGGVQADSLVTALASDLGAVRFAGLSHKEVEDIPLDSLPRPPGQVYFVASQGPGVTAELEPVPIQDRVVFAVSLPNVAQAVGLEAFTPAVGARLRSVVMPIPTDRPALSDLLVFRPLGQDLPETRTRAIALMMGDMRIPRDELVGLYLEGYGIDPEAELSVSLTIVGEEEGLLGRIRGIFGGGRQERATVNWTEPPRGEAIFRRSIELNVAGLEEGKHVLRVAVTLPDGTVLNRDVTIEILPAQWSRQ